MTIIGKIETVLLLLVAWYASKRGYSMGVRLASDAALHRNGQRGSIMVMVSERP